MSPARVRHALRSYLVTRIWTAKQTELLDELLRLLEHHLDELDRATERTERWREGQKCLAVLARMRSGLQLEAHPELVSRLGALYGFIGARVVEGLLEEERALDSARRVASQLRTAVSRSWPDGPYGPDPRS